MEIMGQSLQDNDPTIRQGAVDVLRWSLRLLRDRSLEMRTNIYKKVYTLAENGLKTAKSVDSVHGSLLVFGTTQQSKIIETKSLKTNEKEIILFSFF